MPDRYFKGFFGINTKGSFWECPELQYRRLREANKKTEGEQEATNDYIAKMDDEGLFTIFADNHSILSNLPESVEHINIETRISKEDFIRKINIAPEKFESEIVDVTLKMKKITEEKENLEAEDQSLTKKIEETKDTLYDLEKDLEKIEKKLSYVESDYTHLIAVIENDPL